VFSPHAVACGGHFRAMIDSVGPGKDRNLGFYRVLQHRKPFDAQKENDWGFAWLPKWDQSYDVIKYFNMMDSGKVTGYFCQGFN
ncbi:hypothetical protein ONJ16_27030, partial [Salmonella enterica subsp. enterica serovar Montevideo]|nr:hypothetical protein [Salmonella enterica subsp. enterica serovar Montevideo]